MERLAKYIAGLYATPPDAGRELAYRFAPVLRLDANEPFRPLASGYTIFRENGRSPSFPRSIKLAAGIACVIEYAIWWDWDIHHLYELEHVWLHLDAAGEIAQVEGSRHGKAIKLDEHGRPPIHLFASPGKHAFASDPALFQAEHRRAPGLTTRYAGSGGVGGKMLFNGRFARTPPGDRLIAAYLKQRAFTPAWEFDNAFTFRPEMLVPWPVLRDWIPGRVEAWQAFLQRSIPPQIVQPIRAAVCPTATAVFRAGLAGVEMAQISVRGWMDTLCALAACRKARLAAYLLPQNGRSLRLLSWLLKRGDWSDYLMTGSRNPAGTARLKAALPGYRAALILRRPRPDALIQAQRSGADYLHVLQSDQLTGGWVAKARQAGLGVIAGPVRGETAVAWLQSLGVDGIIIQEKSPASQAFSRAVY